MDRPWWPPSWLTFTVVAALGLVGLAVAVTWYEVTDARNDARSECEQTVTFQRDLRTMWLKLFEAFPEQAEETGLRADLEVLHPPLRCEGSTLVPDPGG